MGVLDSLNLCSSLHIWFIWSRLPCATVHLTSPTHWIIISESSEHKSVWLYLDSIWKRCELIQKIPQHKSSAIHRMQYHWKGNSIKYEFQCFAKQSIKCETVTGSNYYYHYYCYYILLAVRRHPHFSHRNFPIVSMRNRMVVITYFGSALIRSVQIWRTVAPTVQIDRPSNVLFSLTLLSFHFIITHVRDSVHVRACVFVWGRTNVISILFRSYN